MSQDKFREGEKNSYYVSYKNKREVIITNNYKSRKCMNVLNIVDISKLTYAIFYNCDFSASLVHIRAANEASIANIDSK